MQLVEGDVRDMGAFAAASFDYVFALGGVVSYCSDPAVDIGEMARVLEPGGELLADDIHSRCGSMRYAARHGNLDLLEKLAYSTDAALRTPVLLPDELEALAHQAGLADARVWAEFMFEVDNEIRVGPDTERGERVVLELEMRYCGDARFLGGGALVLRAVKGGSIE